MMTGVEKSSDERVPKVWVEAGRHKGKKQGCPWNMEGRVLNTVFREKDAVVKNNCPVDPGGRKTSNCLTKRVFFSDTRVSERGTQGRC